MAEAKILTRLRSQIAARGKSRKDATAIAVAALQKQGNLKKGSTEPTPKGVRRGNMSAGERATDRAVKYSGGKHKPSDYKYSSKTNRSTLKGK